MGEINKKPVPNTLYNTTLNIKTIFRLLLSFEFILWVLSWIGDLNGKLPESTYGMFFSSILIGCGIYFWLKSYKEQVESYPKFYKIYREQTDSMKKNPFNGMFFMGIVFDRKSKLLENYKETVKTIKIK